MTELQRAELEPVWVLIAATIAYLVYFYGSRSAFLARVTHDADPEIAAAKKVIAGRFLGAVSLGSLGLYDVVLGHGVPGLAIPRLQSTLWFFGFVAIVVLPVVAFSSTRPKSWTDYPQLRWSQWDRKKVIENVISWAAYLFGYELYFRGVLTFTMAMFVDDLFAVAIVTVIYVLVHLDKPASEAIGTLPMGFVFGMTAIATGSFLPVFAAHVVIALTSDFFSARANPAIRWRSS
jgi:membrane protease YdiL (CAAX protease family)